MTPIPETPEGRKAYENKLRVWAERQQLRLVRSSRRDPKVPEYGTYTLISPSGNGRVVLEHASMQEIYDCLDVGSNKYATVPPGERIDAVEGSIVGVMSGVTIEILESGKRFQVAEDGELLELPDKGWLTIANDDR